MNTITPQRPRASRGSWHVRPASAKQIAYLESLITACGKDPVAVIAAEPNFNAGRCSQLIDHYRNQAGASTAPASPRPNQYPGQCSKCRHEVPVGAGLLSKNPVGKYIVTHQDGQCPATPAPDYNAAPVGVHLLDGEYIKVFERSGRKYVQRLYIRDDKTGKFVRADRKYLLKVSERTLLNYAQACEFGLKHSFCVCCSAHLEDALSIVRGIGPVCEKWSQFSKDAPPRTAQAKRDAVEFIQSGRRPEPRVADTSNPNRVVLDPDHAATWESPDSDAAPVEAPTPDTDLEVKRPRARRIVRR